MPLHKKRLATAVRGSSEPSQSSLSLEESPKGLSFESPQVTRVKRSPLRADPQQYPVATLYKTKRVWIEKGSTYEVGDTKYAARFLTQVVRCVQVCERLLRRIQLSSGCFTKSLSKEIKTLLAQVQKSLVTEDCPNFENSRNLLGKVRNGKTSCLCRLFR